MKKILLGLGVLAAFGLGSVNADECKSDCCDTCWYVGVDFLYWTAYDADLDYGVNNYDGWDVALNSGAESKMHFAEYNWDPGFRVFAGYKDKCNGWDARLSYLYFKSDNTDSATYGTGDTDHIKPTLWSPSFGTDRCQTATASIELEYNVFDITVGRPCCICEGFTFRPYGGFRALILDQKMRVVYEGGRDFSTYDGIVDWNSSFDAYGLTGGFDWKLDLGCGFSAFGTVAGSVVGGETDDRELQSGPDAVGGGSQIVNNINVREQQFIGVPGYQLALGASYEGCCEMECACFCYKLGLSYEMNHWFNVPELRRFNGSGQEAANNGGGAKGCLLLHGLVVRGCVSF